jgi:GDP-mannose 6-dehydrogenase
MDRKLNISEAYLRPGFAFGGSCLPKDVRALLHAARTADLAVPVLGAILPSNERQIQQGIARVLATRRRRIGVLGLAFKPDTDDLRESPMVRLVEGLIGKGCDVRILDRSVSIARLGGANRRYIEEEIPHIASLMCESLDPILEHAEVLVVGNGGEDARRGLALARPDQAVVDLTRSVGRSR